MAAIDDIQILNQFQPLTENETYYVPRKNHHDFNYLLKPTTYNTQYLHTDHNKLGTYYTSDTVQFVEYPPNLKDIKRPTMDFYRIQSTKEFYPPYLKGSYVRFENRDRSFTKHILSIKQKPPSNDDVFEELKRKYLELVNTYENLREQIEIRLENAPHLNEFKPWFGTFTQRIFTDLESETLSSLTHKPLEIISNSINTVLEDIYNIINGSIKITYLQDQSTEENNAAENELKERIKKTDDLRKIEEAIKKRSIRRATIIKERATIIIKIASFIEELTTTKTRFEKEIKDHYEYTSQSSNSELSLVARLQTTILEDNKIDKLSLKKSIIDERRRIKTYDLTIEKDNLFSITSLPERYDIDRQKQHKGMRDRLIDEFRKKQEAIRKLVEEFRAEITELTEEAEDYLHAITDSVQEKSIKLPLQNLRDFFTVVEQGYFEIKDDVFIKSGAYLTAFMSYNNLGEIRYTNYNRMDYIINRKTKKIHNGISVNFFSDEHIRSQPVNPIFINDTAEYTVPYNGIYYQGKIFILVDDPDFTSFKLILKQ